MKKTLFALLILSLGWHGLLAQKKTDSTAAKPAAAKHAVVVDSAKKTLDSLNQVLAASLKDKDNQLKLANASLSLFQETNSQLNKELTGLKSTEAELAAVKLENDELKKADEANKKQLSDYKSKLDEANELKAKFDKLTAADNKTSADLTEATNQLADAKENLKTKTDEASALGKRNDLLSKFILNGFDADVHAAIGGFLGSDPSQFKALMDKGNQLKSIFTDAPEIDNDLQLLENYDHLADAFAEAKMILDKPYEANAVAAALTKLQRFEKADLKSELKTQLQVYIGLLNQYCKIDAQFSQLMFDAAIADKNGDILRCIYRLGPASKLPAEKYTYLRRDVNEKTQMVNNNEKISDADINNYDARRKVSCTITKP